MKNKLLGFLLLIVSIAAIYSSFKIFKSASYQTFLMWDFNNETHKTPYEIYAQKLDANYPNLTFTALPMKYIQSKYFIHEDSINKAKTLLFEAINSNPYIKAPELLLSDIYSNEKKYDSSLYFAKDAFYNLPNVNAHRSVFFRALTHFKDSIELDKAFNIIKDFNNPNHWYEYFTSRHSIVGKGDKKLMYLIDDFKKKFPNEDPKQINEIETLVKIGGERFSLSYLFANEADDKFQEKEYTEAINLYETSISFNKYEYVFYENAALVYGLLEEYDKAISYYDKVIYEFKTVDGKSEYLKGLLKIQLGNSDEGCKYLKASSEKRYEDSSTGIKATDLFSRFCME